MYPHVVVFPMGLNLHVGVSVIETYVTVKFLFTGFSFCGGLFFFLSFSLFGFIEPG